MTMIVGTQDTLLCTVTMTNGMQDPFSEHGLTLTQVSMPMTIPGLKAERNILYTGKRSVFSALVPWGSSTKGKASR